MLAQSQATMILLSYVFILYIPPSDSSYFSLKT